MFTTANRGMGNIQSSLSVTNLHWLTIVLRSLSLTLTNWLTIVLRTLSLTLTN